MACKMKIGAVVLGTIVTDTKTVLESGSIDQTYSRNTNQSIPDSLLTSLENDLHSILPRNAEYSFYTGLNKESQIVDLELFDVYVVYPFGNISDLLFAALFAKNRPIIIAEPPYKDYWSYGGVYYPYFVRDSREISRYINIRQDVFVAKDRDDLKSILAAFSVKYRINNATVLCVGEPMREPFHSWNWGYAMVKAIQEKYGIKWKNVSSDKFLNLFQNWKGNYPKNHFLEEVQNDYTNKELNKMNIEKMYYLLKDLVEEHSATAFTINCLWSTIHTGLQATSCYALSKLNDSGIVAACEADVTTLLNMMILVYASGCPAFMLNPYLFPADNKLFVSHCSSPTLHSLDGKEKDPFNLYDYYENPSLPCGIQVLHEPGPVTITGISHNEINKMIIVKGNMVGNTAFSSCRTQLEIDIDGDIKHLAEQYQGRHWALVYGDHVNDIAKANELMNIENIII